MFAADIAKELGLRPSQVEKTVELLDEGNTIPFIARYRKEATGELDENQIRAVGERLEYLRNLAARKEEVLRSIGEQGKLTPELEVAIQKAKVLQEVEDLYLPFRPKRRTRAGVARERGLEPLAQLMLVQGEGAVEEAAQPYVDPEKEVPTVEAALQGAQDIVAEEISDNAEVRKWIRAWTWREGILISKAKDPEKVTPYQMYYEYQEPVAKIPPHRILAVNRGEKEEILSVKIEAPVEKIISRLEADWVKHPSSPWAPLVKEAATDAYKRLIAPAIEREIRGELTTKGEEQAIKIFSANLRQLLLQPPVRGQVVLGLDPGFRTGCKLAVVDETGKVLQVGVIYPHPPQNRREEAKKEIARMIREHGAALVAIGNGTASRETEEVVAETIAEEGLPAQYIIVSEAGASVYSASPLAREEFPQYDLSLRSAVSIARRLQDPLAELVKIEPKAVGVGQYQHDVNPKRLESSLGAVVESCVNAVGVDLNTASPSLLSYVAGLKPAVAKNIVAFREAQGKFRRRGELKKVPRLGEQTFIQCAGFIRLPDGEDPLDNTPVHPESYGVADKLLAKIGHTKEDLKKGVLAPIREKLGQLNLEELAREWEVGLPTLRDIVAALQKPGRDPREDLPKPLFHKEITTIESLKPGMVLQGTVRNVVDFGAFVDIGLKNDGLVHLSQLSNKYVRHPMEVVAVGDIVNVKVLNVDLTRQRVSLTMKDIGD